VTIRWRGRGLDCEEQVANALDSFVDLTPASDAPAAAVKAAWLPLQEGQSVPLIGERVYPDAEPGDCL
jgi:hypothetical protein